MELSECSLVGTLNPATPSYPDMALLEAEGPPGCVPGAGTVGLSKPGSLAGGLTPRRSCGSIGPHRRGLQRLEVSLAIGVPPRSWCWERLVYSGETLSLSLSDPPAAFPTVFCPQAVRLCKG